MPRALGKWSRSSGVRASAKTLFIGFILVCMCFIQFRQFQGEQLLNSMKEEGNDGAGVHLSFKSTPLHINVSLNDSYPTFPIIDGGSDLLSLNEGNLSHLVEHNITALTPSTDHSPTRSTPSNHDNKEPFDWEREGDMTWTQSKAIGIPGKTCHVVENICRTSNKHWFYFVDDDMQYTHNHHPRQPQFSLKNPRFGSQSAVNIDMDISLVTSKQSLSQIREQQCNISSTENHVVLTSDHIHMMGEFYQRVVVPIHHLIQEFLSHTNQSVDVKGDDLIRFYLYFKDDENRNLLDSHFLYMKGIPFGDNLHSWVKTTKSSLCQCYTRLIFCGFTGEYSSNDNITKLEVKPHGIVPHNVSKHCAHYNTPTEYMEADNCQTWQELRHSLIHTFELRNPDLKKDVLLYRSRLILGALQNVSSDAVATFSDDALMDWKIIGFSQRKGRRIWLNMNESLSHCNTIYHSKRIVCVEVEVENLPTNFTTEQSNQPISSVDEQMIFYQSINALIGIHGSQLTQGVLMPPGSVMVEMFQWIPPKQHWGVEVWGDGWTNQRNRPTPMGLMWHNTDINEIGYGLSRESVPLCLHKSDQVIHNFSQNVNAASQDYERVKNGNATELEFCLQVLNGDEWRWDERNFNVGHDVIDKFLDTFFQSRLAETDASTVNLTERESEVRSCSDWVEQGENNGFIMYNLVCKDTNGSVYPHHYYHY